MKRTQLIKKYVEFFESKDHKRIENKSLIPENDPTVLFTTAGMHPLVPFLLGQKHPSGKRLVGVQRCIRTGDIEEVGDETHHTFFEMLGNWSIGDYFKKEAIEYSFEFLTNELEIPKEKLSVTVFEGDETSPKDTESEKIWKNLGIEKINFLGKKDNWWGPAGKTGPCGPDTEMFVNNVEIWNDVFMEYEKNNKGEYVAAKQKNVDTGMGVERTLALMNNTTDNYLTDVFKPIIEKIEELSNRKYDSKEGTQTEMRIITDHIKAAVFILNDGIVPSNSEQGYVLRRLIRRAIRQGRHLEIKNFTKKLAQVVFEIYPDYNLKKEKILSELKKEEDKFEKTIEKGLKEFKRFSDNKKIDGKESFLLYQSYGFPIEMIKEECQIRNIEFDEKDFYNELKKHQELSRTASAGKFKSGLADHSVETTKLHTACHLLLEALKKVLDPKIEQRGSNITAERLRFDFNFDRKLTEQEKKKIEDLVNQEIKKEHIVTSEEMSPQEAKEQGASGIFDEKYGDKVSVYTIGDFSKEICTGPHVENTKDMGTFRITKEQSSSAGVRRIKAVLE